MEQKKIDRINELARKAKSEGLTDTEITEQSELRKEYLAAVRANFKATLDQIEIVDQEKQNDFEGKKFVFVLGFDYRQKTNNMV